MKEVWRYANPTESAHRPRLILSLFKRDSLDSHGAQACEQERCAEPPAIDLAIYLARRLVDSHFLKQARKLFVADAPPNHLGFYQLRRSVFPSLIRLSHQRALFQRFVHHCLSAWKRLTPIPSRNSPTAIFSRMRLIAAPAHYTFSARYFFEDKLLKSTFRGSLLRELAARGWTPDEGAIQVPTLGGAA